MKTGPVADILARLASVLPAACGPWPLHAPLLGPAEQEAVLACLQTGWVSSAAPAVADFEAGLSRLTGVHAVAMVNGTAALHLALQLAGVGPGDEVLTPALTFVASANAVTWCGARPHFVDCEPRSLGVDPQKLADYLRRVLRHRGGRPVNRQTGRPVTALLVTHVFGRPPALPDLLRVAQHHDLPLIEDAAEAIGAVSHGVAAGTTGLCGILSFNGNKTITTGGGGALLTRDPDLAARARHLGSTARTSGTLEWTHDAVGYNYRLPGLNAALGLAQLKRLPDILAAKSRLAAACDQAFAGCPHAALLPAIDGGNHWLNALLLHPDRAGSRLPLLEACRQAGYGCRPFWMPLHRLPVYRDCPAMDLSVTGDLFARGLCLPSGPVPGHLA